MKIVVCSGKGGTGKTTIATSLALSLVDQVKTWYVDCDVEAPNGHIFLNPELTEQIEAGIKIPKINQDLCSACGRCVEVCQFHALALIGGKILVFPQLCHGCGSCTWNCPDGAIEEVLNLIGVLEAGKTREEICFTQGLLTISEPMPTPIIRQLKRWKKPKDGAVVILDSPPGASCSVVETIRGADYALIVTEPTPFGLHDLRQVLGILDDMHIPFGVLINRDGIGNEEVECFLNDKHIPILMRIPYAKALAEGLAKGKNLIEIQPEYFEQFKKLFTLISMSAFRAKS